MEHERKQADRAGKPERAGREGGPRRPGRAGGLLNRASCTHRAEVSNDSAIPKEIRRTPKTRASFLSVEGAAVA
eukprot:8080258-Pyramimonas_sp.AAC.1